MESSEVRDVERDAPAILRQLLGFNRSRDSRLVEPESEQDLLAATVCSTELLTPSSRINTGAVNVSDCFLSKDSSAGLC
jgi:hypothetical protein